MSVCPGAPGVPSCALQLSLSWNSSPALSLLRPLCSLRLLQTMIALDQQEQLKELAEAAAS